MTEHTLEARKTRNYVGTWQHLDEWEDIGTYTYDIKGHAEELDDEDGTKPVRQTHLLKVTTKADSDTTRQAIEAGFTSHGCSHEYDCCGCRSFYADAIEIAPNYWRVVINSSRNY